MTCVFLTTRHLPGDERIFHHMAVTLAGAGHTAVVASSMEEKEGVHEGVLVRSFDGTSMSRKEKKNVFVSLLKEIQPDLIICSEPFTVHIASCYKKQHRKEVTLIYDITEWFPSKKDLFRHTMLSGILLAPAYLIYNLLAAARTDAFIFGEWYKSRPYRLLFGRKKHLFLGYYPDLRYIPYTEPSPLQDELRLSYSGTLSSEKGFGNFLEVVKALGEKRPGLNITVRVVGQYAGEKEKKMLTEKIAGMPENVQVASFPFLEFHAFLQTIKNTDIFLDLRKDDPENQRCLPIKVFYYAAFGRPVIYSDLKALRREVETGLFGYLVRPRDAATVVTILEGYLDDPQLYLSHCRNARLLAQERYNWPAVSGGFVTFLEKSIVS